MPINISVLEDIPFFRNLNKSELEEIAKISREVSFSKKFIIFNNQDKAEAFYIILEGEVIISRELSDKNQDITKMGRGAILGDLAFLSSDEKYFISAKTLTRVRLIKISIEEFKKLLKEKQSFAAYKLIYKMAQKLSFRLARFGEQFIKLMENDGKGKEKNIIDYIKNFFRT